MFAVFLRICGALTLDEIAGEFAPVSGTVGDVTRSVILPD